MRIRTLTSRPAFRLLHHTVLLRMRGWIHLLPGLFAVFLVPTLLLTGCEPTEGELIGFEDEDEAKLSDRELYRIAEEYYHSGDETVLDQVTNWSDAELVVDYIAELEGGYEDWESADENGARWSSGLPDCGYLYPSPNFSTWANYAGSMSYIWSPNCYIQEWKAWQDLIWSQQDPDHGPPCGGDGDNLVSFWMGPDWTTNRNDYNVFSTGASANAWLYLKQIQHALRGGSNVRIHTNGPYGNAYFCLPTRFNPERLRFGR